jgi:hypothetical protein
MSRRGGALPIAIVALCLGAPAAPAAADSAAALYQPDRVDVIDLTLPPTSVDGLEAEPEEYQPGTFSLAETDGTPAGEKPASTPVKVEVRLKGSGSFRPLTGKAAFKLKFKKDERPFGLKKMTLNNLVEDPSMIRETLAYAAFTAAGAPASRTSYAYVRVNGEDFGLHLDLETLDDQSMERLFGAFDGEAQHLYEGEEGTDVKPGSATAFDVDEGDKKDLGDLEALIAAVSSGGSAPWSTRVAATADLREMTRMWAVERYVGQRDGYTGVEAPYHPSNYYLVSDLGGKFQMLPSGLDETWRENNHLAFDEGVGVMFARCLEDPACRAIYWESLAAARAAVAAAGLDALAVRAASLLAPWQQLEQSSPRHEFSLGEIAAAVAATRAFIASRPAEADAWLADNRPQLESPSGSTPAGSASPRRTVYLRVGRVRLVGGALRTEVQLRSAGAVTQRAKIATAGSNVVCRDRAEVARARDLTLRCHLPATLRKRLREKWLALRLVTRFAPAASRPEVTTRHITLRRTTP